MCIVVPYSTRTDGSRRKCDVSSVIDSSPPVQNAEDSALSERIMLRNRVGNAMSFRLAVYELGRLISKTTSTKEFRC